MQSQDQQALALKEKKMGKVLEYINSIKILMDSVYKPDKGSHGIIKSTVFSFFYDKKNKYSLNHFIEIIIKSIEYEDLETFTYLIQEVINISNNLSQNEITDFGIIIKNAIEVKNSKILEVTFRHNTYSNNILIIRELESKDLINYLKIINQETINEIFNSERYSAFLEEFLKHIDSDKIKEIILSKIDDSINNNIIKQKIDECYDIYNASSTEINVNDDESNERDSRPCENQSFSQKIEEGRSNQNSNRQQI